MWTAKIIDKGVEKDRIAVQVEFSKDGEESIKINFTARTGDEINRTIKNYKDSLDSRDSELEAITVGEWVEPEPVEPEPEPEKTADEIAADAWLEQWNNFVAAEKAMDALKRNGIEPTTEEQTAFDALKTWVADNRKPEYSKLIAGTV